MHNGNNTLLNTKDVTSVDNTNNVIIAIDVYYLEDKAKAVGVIFRNWDDSEPLRIISTYVENPLEYEPGLFYKRELPCILKLLECMDINQISTIIVDGYVYLDNEFKAGLGYHVYKSFNNKIPVIGVAKTMFYNHHKDDVGQLCDDSNKNVVTKVNRGKSKNPLYISSVGINVKEAALCIQNMNGNYRIPTLLKLLDTKTRECLKDESS